MEPLKLDFSQFTILAVDDTPANLTIVTTYLAQTGFNILTADNGRSALELAGSRHPDLILLDVMMPEMDGIQVCKTLKKAASTAEIPVIFMTALANVDDKVKGFQAGAVDYITKPLSKRELLARITIHLKNQMLTRSYKQHANYLETSSRLGQQVTSILDLEKLLTEAVQLIQSRFLYYCVTIWIKNPHADTLILQALAGRDIDQFRPADGEIPLDASKSIIVQVWQNGSPYLTNDVYNNPVFLPSKSLPLTHSEYAIPLQIGETTIGVLDVQDDQIGAFDEEDRTVLRLMADQLAIAMQNARLYGRLSQFNQQLEQEVARRTAALQKSNAQLGQMDRAKSDFINVASHELFTPISLIKGYAQILAEDEDIRENENQARIVRGINRGVQRLHEIVDSMLDVAKIDNAAFQLYYQPVSLSALWSQLGQQMEPALNERHITLNIEPGLTLLDHIEADPEALYKVFYQLLMNAIKYTPDGGLIRVNGRFPTPETVEITVQDTGIGIAPDNHETIFHKFYQTGQVDLHSTGMTKFKGGGPGLGLAIAKGLVDTHQGKIWVESPAHNEETCPGSTFFVQLPRYCPNSHQ